MWSSFPRLHSQVYLTTTCWKTGERWAMENPCKIILLAFLSLRGVTFTVSPSLPLSLSLSLPSFEASGVYSTSRVFHSVPSRRPALWLLVAAKTYGSLKVGSGTNFDVVTWCTVHG